MTQLGPGGEFERLAKAILPKSVFDAISPSGPQEGFGWPSRMMTLAGVFHGARESLIGNYVDLQQRISDREILNKVLGRDSAEDAAGKESKVGSARIRARKATISVEQANMSELFRLLAPPIRSAMRGMPFAGGTSSGLGFVSMPLANGSGA